MPVIGSSYVSTVLMRWRKLTLSTTDTKSEDIQLLESDLTHVYVEAHRYQQITLINKKRES